MELYRLIADINNTATTFAFDYVPENFEGVKIAQKFSFKNPIGYTPKFSVDTMRIIKSDKATIDAVFDSFGLESDVTILIQKLKATGFGYDSVSTFAIDFESYEKFDEYSEFALKSISAIDAYNRIKSSEIDIILADVDALNFTMKGTNRLYLKAWSIEADIDQIRILQFQKTGDKEPYFINFDSSLFPNDKAVYNFGLDTVTANTIEFKNVAGVYSCLCTENIKDIKFVLCKNNPYTVIHTVVQQLAVGATVANLTIPTSFSVAAQNYAKDDVLLFAIIITNELDEFITPLGESLSFQFELNKLTDTYIVPGERIIKSVSVNSVFSTIFDNNATSTLATKYALTGGNALYGKSDTITIKPSDFLNDICKAMGLVVNFKIDGSVAIADSFSNYFDGLLNVANAIEIVDFKDVSVKFTKDLSYSTISVGRATATYTAFAYLFDWNKILTFKQNGRNANEELNLTLSKIRNDFSGVIDILHTQFSDENNKDVYLINSNFESRASSGGEPIYDVVTPRDIAENWRLFLSFAFQNFGKDTLTISSNGGTTDDLQISGVNQMDDFVLAETPRLLPIEYNFTCLLDQIDFSEQILKINHEGADVYLFVIEAETTDKLSEQKIKALKIQF